MRITPPVQGERRYVVVTRHPGAAAHFGNPTTIDRAFVEAQEITDRKVGVYELRLVKP